ncbi:hypothetical protein T484DRAFT_1769569 [Baffinella frigidus]|nr:hypothetical protein T484DRAFT_1769569 [Cryptophyta sp. CCMP2293]
MSVFEVRESAGWDGRHAVLTRAVHSPGELLLFEAPLAVIKPDFSFDGAFPSSGDEVRDNAWQLTHELLAAGKRGAWARAGYVVEAKGAEVESPAAVAWLANKFKCSAEDVLDVFRAVGNNAFSLDTAVLRIKYGAAFFAQEREFHTRKL